MILTYGSVCSGIEAATVAWHPLGHIPLWFAQFDPEHNYKRGPDFPSLVLAERWPNVPNLGDMTLIKARIESGEIPAPDVIVGGTPCQAYSIAGQRKGLDDERGALTLAYVELIHAIDKKRREEGKPPVIIIWENVPGVLSMPDNAFGHFLAGLAGEDDPLLPSGKKWTDAGLVAGPTRTLAWRVLDAQFFAVAQRRQRVFVVGSARNDFNPAAVLLELDRVRRDSPPSRSERQEATGTPAGCPGARSRADTGGLSHWDGDAHPHPTLNQTYRRGGSPGASNQEVFMQRGAGLVGVMAHGQGGAEISLDNSSPTLTCNHEAPIVFNETGAGWWNQDEISGVLRAGNNDGLGAARESTLITFPAQMSGTQFHCANDEVSQTLTALNPTAICYPIHDKATRYKGGGDGRQNDGSQNGLGIGKDTDPCPTLDTSSHHAVGVVSVALRGRDGDLTAELGDEVSTALRSAEGGANKAHVLDEMAIRRLMPVEYERLQGFPDHYTLIPVNKMARMEADRAAWLRQYFPEIDEQAIHRLAADGPRYKALGNSMAVPVMAWLMNRITGHLEATSQPVEQNNPAPQPVKKTMSKKQKPAEPRFTRPFLKWPGGKYSVLDQLLPHIGGGERLIEPFVGAGSVFLNSSGFKRYLLADNNRDLINLWLAIQNAPMSLIEIGRRMLETLNTPDGFFGVREKFNEGKYGIFDRAAAFMYLNRTAFNGLMRYNLSGGFNTSYGHYKKPYFPEKEIQEFMFWSKSCDFVRQSFVDTIRQAGIGDTVFCDPPYMPLPGKEDAFTSYTADPFTEECQWQLLNEMVAAHKRGARVVVTNSGAPSIRENYEKNGFKIYPLYARRSMSCKGGTRGIAADIIGVLET